MTLDHPALTGRLKSTTSRRSDYERRPVAFVHSRLMSDVRPVVKKPAAAKPVFKTAGTALPGRSVHPSARRLSRTAVLKRELVAAKRPGKRRTSRRSLRLSLPVALAVALFGFGLYVGVSGLHTTHKVAAQVTKLTIAADNATGTTTNPDAPLAESKPRASGAYHVAPDMPQTITIPKLSVNARILRTSVNSKNQLGTPSNIFDTAWYDGSAKPGQPGAILIDGHVSGPTQNGVFYGLKTLVAGDKIRITRGDGTVFSYSVVASKIYGADDVDMTAALTPVVAGKPGLNLITCTGKVDSSGSHFVQRVIVFASQD